LGFGISGIEPSGYATTVLVTLVIYQHKLIQNNHCELYDKDGEFMN
jgi:hypothetical protein